jgi:hypothetical protein
VAGVKMNIVYFTDYNLLKGIPTIPNGNKMDGQFFPLLFDLRGTAFSKAK